MEAFAAALPEAPTPPSKRRSKRLVRKCEQILCRVAQYFPLLFVYGLSTWAVWVQTIVGFEHSKNLVLRKSGAIAGIVFYLCLVTSYSVAVFTDPGSPLNTRSSNGDNGRIRHGYSHLPTSEVPRYNALTVNSSGGSRYCKKCQCPKPDRAHHCSTCKRCVLKMDHHCPWLATCVGLYNYKAFLLFLIYTCFFCYLCFAISANWVWTEMLNESRYAENAFPANVVMLAITAGVIGLVLSGFAAWHLSLAMRNLTTIECLEKTRYLTPLRKTFDNQRRQFASYDGHDDTAFGNTLHDYGQRFIDMHANAIPGVTREEEGEERPSPKISSHNIQSTSAHAHEDDHRSPAQRSLFRSYEELERNRERDRYEEYLDEEDSKKLPNAFDHGWRQNLTHLFGPKPFFWLLPFPSTIGDGWHWEASSTWLEARQRIERRRLKRWEEAQQQQQHPSQAHGHINGHWNPDGSWQGPYSNHQDPQAPRFYDGTREMHQSPVSLNTLPPRPSARKRGNDGDVDSDFASDRYSTSSDEERENLVSRGSPLPPRRSSNQKSH